ncbi:hypothetical protein D3C79_996680 [compost metagenome]
MEMRMILISQELLIFRSIFMVLIWDFPIRDLICKCCGQGKGNYNIIGMMRVTATILCVMEMAFQNG